MLVAWLMLIFGSFGYRAPRNHIVVTTLVVSAALVAVALYLILDAYFGERDRRFRERDRFGGFDVARC
jgi:hypothetical protein